ncbi:hypothetical protein LOTGIDRAFT_156166 [Lottia gigantea]|uniref:Uncharacterized protein n=1 Tax=Lottia gigantea TaxID=225164 RepID=V4BBJ7_LOTGI|nr:hypothetical protein LOTGIDRAFT_156166 [Lottia gigantea]ESP04926.1 hypothetical protein LOTGIDRAFT_156166 [Lottia gigantea]
MGFEFDEHSDEYEVPVNKTESERSSMNQSYGQTYAAMDGGRNFPPSPRQMYNTNNTYEEMTRHNGSTHRSLEKIPPVLPTRSPDTRLSNSTGTSSRGSSISEHDNITYADSHYSTPSPPMSPGKKHHQGHYGSGQSPYSYVPNSNVLQQQLQHQELYSRAEGLYDTYIHNDDHLVQQSAYGQSPQNQKHMQIGKSVKKMASPVLTHKMYPYQNGPNGTQSSPKLRRASEADANQSMKVKGKNVGSPKLPLKFQQKSASIDCGQTSVPPPPSFPAPPPPLHVQERYHGNNPRCPSPPLPPPPPEHNQGSTKKPGMPPPLPPVSTIPGRQSRPQEVSGYQSPRSASHSRSSSSVGSVESSAAIIQELGQVKLKPRNHSGTNGNVSTDNASGNELSKIQLKKTKTDKIGDIYQESAPPAEKSPSSSISSLTAGIVPICDIDDFPLPPPPEELLSSIPPPVVQPAYSQSAGVQRQNSGVQRPNSGVHQEFQRQNSGVHQELQRQNSSGGKFQQQTPASNGVNRFQGFQTPSSPVNKTIGSQSPFGAQNHQPSSPITNKKFPVATPQSPVAKQPPQMIPKVPSVPVLPKSQIAPPSEPMIPKTPSMPAVAAQSQGIPSAPPVPKTPNVPQTSNGNTGHIVTIVSRMFFDFGPNFCDYGQIMIFAIFERIW